MIFGYARREDYVDSKGNLWRPATEFVTRTGYGTDSVVESLWTDRRTLYIGNTDDPELYRYGIHGKEFRVNVTVGPGTYDVRLLFADTPLHWFLEPDPDGGFLKRIMNVEIDGERVIEKRNVAGEAGGTFRALNRTFRSVEPQNGIIEIRCTGAEGRDAILQALEVVPVSSPR